VSSRLAALLGAARCLLAYDGGATWKSVKLIKGGDGWFALLFHPDLAGFVSLRAAATDSGGSSVQETILRAYRLRR
jgi:hypothetical protein